MQLIEPDNLSEVLKDYIAAQSYDGLYTASMDHSPSEQLSGAGWHTTVLVLSAGVEHAQLARDIARTLRPRVGKLTKWSKAGSRYRDMFSVELARYLPKYPVYILAVSATASAIRQSEKHFLNELLLTDRYQRTINVKGSVSVTLGPFWRGPSRKKVMVHLHERRALMCLFISHFVLYASRYVPSRYCTRRRRAYLHELELLR